MPRFRSSNPSLRVLPCSATHIPHCPHGPTILFERHTCRKQGVETFFACSANRDRKLCSFYQKVIDGNLKNRGKQQSSKKIQTFESHGQCLKRGKLFKALSLSERVFCVKCGLLLLSKEKPEHSTHKLKEKITDDDLLHPSTLLQPLVSNKSNAQYLFSDRTIKFVIDLLRNLGFKKVLCVGVPRLHEEIQIHQELGLSSLLLDIDHRLMQFYQPEFFIRYNMFNNHFFSGEKSNQILTRFLLEDTGPVVLVTDPPFGGMAELLANSLRALSERWRMTNDIDTSNKLLPLLWFFPYFLEYKVSASLPDLHMLDYKVGYDNHKKFRNEETNKVGRTVKQGSVVRIFTNIEPSKVRLPPEEGYRFCKKCQRYVSQENRHCSKCDACTSKDGSTYIHCDRCKRCVKSNKQHCDLCGFCVIPTQHPCTTTKTGNDESSSELLENKDTSLTTHRKRKKKMDRLKSKKMRQ